jgi:outer membrane protein assembly factor BamB
MLTPGLHPARHARTFFLATALLALGAQALPAADWPHWRGPDYNGISKETGWSATLPASGPKILWKANVGTGFSSFAVAAGRVYTMGNKDNQDTVYAFDAASGKVAWKHTYDEKLQPKYYEGGPSATPTVDGDRVYVLSKTALLQCLDAANGKVLWTNDVPQSVAALNDGKPAKTPDWGFAGSVLVFNNTLYVNVGKYGTALDKSGKVLWTTGPEAAGYSTHVPYTLGGKTGLAIFAAKDVAGLDPATGKVLWSHPWKTSYDVNAADPIIQGDLVFISSGYKTGASVVRIANNSPTEVWKSKDAMRNQHNNCILIGDYLYGFDGDDSKAEFKCVEFKTGAVKWAQGGLGKGALTAADGKLILNSEMGELVFVTPDPAAYKEISRAQVIGKKCWTSPVLANGRIYVRNEKGDVVCVDVSGK